MFIMYVDESGDTGLPATGSPSRYFCLTGLVVHELRWSLVLAELLSFRHWIKSRYGLYLDDELHAGAMFGRGGELPARIASLKKHERLAILRHFADQLARLPDIRLINVCVDKQTTHLRNSDEVFRFGWTALFQRFENTIRCRNFPRPAADADDRGLVFADKTDAARLRRLLGAMRERNLLTVRGRDGVRERIDEPIRVLVEDPVCRDSRESYFIQAADCAVYLLKQHVQPSGYMKRHGASAYLRTRLKPVLCTEASNKNALGIVML